MDQLELDVSKLAEMRRVDRPAHSYNKLVQLVQLLLQASQDLGDAPATLIFLERAETWCDRLDDFNDKPDETTPKPNQLRLKLFNAFRDVYRKSEQYESCLRYASKGLDIEQQIYSAAQQRLVEQLSQPNASDSRSFGNYAADVNISVGRSMLNVCGLYSKLGRHNLAHKTATECVKRLDEQFCNECAVKEGISSSQDGSSCNAISTEDPERRRRLDTLGVLRIAAIYNQGTELEHLGRSDEARERFAAARSAAIQDHDLPSNHPLMLKIDEALQQPLRPTSNRTKELSHPSSSKKLIPLQKSVAAQDPETEKHQAFLFAKRKPLVAPISLPPGFNQKREIGTAPPNTSRSLRPRQLTALSANQEQRADAVHSSQQASRPVLGQLVNVSRPMPTDSVSNVALVDASLLEAPSTEASGRFPEKQITDILRTSQPSVTRSSSTPRPPPRNANQEVRKRRGGEVTPGIGNKEKSEKDQPQGSIMQQKQAAIQHRYAQWIRDFTQPLFADYQRRHTAALRIQCAWRCTKARLEAFNRRQVYYHFVHQYQKGAVRAILSRFRCFVDTRTRHQSIRTEREELKRKAQVERQQRTAVLTIQKNIRIYIDKKKREEELMRQLKIQQLEKLRQYSTAAVIIQRWWPLIKKEKQYWLKRNEEIIEQRRIHEAEQRRHRSATTIARVARGHLGRNYAHNFRISEAERKRKLQRAIQESIDAIRIVLREYRFRKLRLERQREYEEIREYDAANRIRAGWLESLQRRKMHDINKRARNVRDAARAIQRCWRSFKSRRELRYMIKVRNTTSLIRVEKEWRRERATRKIQCAWRVHEAFKEVRRVKASIGRRKLLATWLFQRVGRAYLERLENGSARSLRIFLYEEAVRNAIATRHRHSSLIQAHARLQLSVLHTTKLKEAVEAEELLVTRRARREMRDDRAATEIQKSMRGHLARKQYAQLKEQMQAHQERVLRATTKLQCFFRVVAAKKKLWQRKVRHNKDCFQRQLYQEVQNEIFADRSNAFASLELLERQRLEEQEAVEMEALCVAYLESVDDDESNDLDQYIATYPEARNPKVLSPNAQLVLAVAQMIVSDEMTQEQQDSPYHEVPKPSAKTLALDDDNDLLGMPPGYQNGENAEEEDDLYD